MTQKTRTRSSSGSRDNEGDYMEVKVVFHAKVVTVKVRRGATKLELIQAVIEEALKEGVQIGNIKQWTVTLNGKKLLIDLETGVILEVDEDTDITREVQNEETEENSVLVMTQNIKGGPKQPMSPEEIEQELEEFDRMEDSFLRSCYDDDEDTDF